MADTCSRYDISRDRTGNRTRVLRAFRLSRDNSRRRRALPLFRALDPVLSIARGGLGPRDNSMRSWFTSYTLPRGGEHGKPSYLSLGILNIYFVGIWRSGKVCWSRMFTISNGFFGIYWISEGYYRRRCAILDFAKYLSAWTSRACIFLQRLQRVFLPYRVSFFFTDKINLPLRLYNE